MLWADSLLDSLLLQKQDSLSTHTYTHLPCSGSAIDDANVRLSQKPEINLRTLQIDFFHIFALHGKVHRSIVSVGNKQRKLLYVAQNLLADTLACAVDADFHSRARQQRRRWTR